LKSIPRLLRLERLCPGFRLLIGKRWNEFLLPLVFNSCARKAAIVLTFGKAPPRPVVIPAYREVPVFVVRNNLKNAGISRDEYFKLLEQCR
jgi:hypothetical protein